MKNIYDYNYDSFGKNSQSSCKCNDKDVELEGCSWYQVGEGYFKYQTGQWYSIGNVV